MSYSLSSAKGRYIVDSTGEKYSGYEGGNDEFRPSTLNPIEVIKGDARSLDYGSYCGTASRGTKA